MPDDADPPAADHRVLDPLEEPDDPLPAGADVGHVHLRVRDLQESVRFYRDVLGFTVHQYYGDPQDRGPRGAAAFLGAGGYHHHIGLNTWSSRGADAPADPRRPGLFHAALRVPTRRDLAEVLARLVREGWPLDGASDHGVSEALYLADPDGNGLEVYRDRGPEDWPRDDDGHLAMVTEPLDLRALLGTLDDPPPLEDVRATFRKPHPVTDR